MNQPQLDNYGRPKQEYVDSLAAMPDKELTEITERKIWLSAYADNNPRSDYHWQVDSCYDEWVRRGNTDAYGRAHSKVVREATGR